MSIIWDRETFQLDTVSASIFIPTNSLSLAIGREHYHKFLVSLTPLSKCSLKLSCGIALWTFDTNYSRLRSQQIDFLFN